MTNQWNRIGDYVPSMVKSAVIWPLVGMGLWIGLLESRGAIFTVTTSADSGVGSLRWAIDQANGNPGPDDIHFNIPGPGPHVIQLQSQLPHVDGHGTDIRGDTQPGYVDRPLVVLNGALFGVVPFSQYRGGGLIFYGNDCRVRALTFGGFRMQPDQVGVVRAGWHEYDEEHSCAVRLHGDNGRVEDCFFGLDWAGEAVTQNGLDAGNLTGVLVRGGTCRIERNVFGLNVKGVWLFDHRPGATVESNQFGLFLDGVTPVVGPNAEGSYSNFGVVANLTRTSVIRGNRFAGLSSGISSARRNLDGPRGSGMQIFGNQFGLGRDGRAVGLNTGILMIDTVGVQIGSESLPGARNYFCSHKPFTRTYYELGGGSRVTPGESFGIHLLGSTEALVVGNTFGESPSGAVRPNEVPAIFTRGEPFARVGVATIRGNRITHSRAGIVAANSTMGLHPAQTLYLEGNLFVNLDGMAIDNHFDGPTPPDPLDADQGVSGLQNQPELQSVTYDAVTDRTRVTGVLRSMPASRYAVELVRMPRAAAQPPEAHAVVARQVVMTDGFGNADFAFVFPGLFVGQAFSATATPADAVILGTGGTSELADALVAPSGRFRLSGGGALMEGSGTVRTLTVTRNGTYGPARVRLAITGSGPGAQPLDYILSEGPVLEFANGEGVKTIEVRAVDDGVHEPFEVYTVELADLVNGFSMTGVGVFSITDNDALPVVSVADVTVTEGDVAVVRVRLSAPSEREVRFERLWWNASAVFGSDFVNVLGGVATIAPGETEVFVTADTVDDVEPELSEWFGFSVANLSNATLDPDSARIIPVTILDNDVPPVRETGFRFSWSVPNLFVSEGDGEVGLMVLRTGSLVGEARVWLRRTAGTASDADFTPNTDVELVFASGEDAKIVPLGVVNDALDETDETFFVTLYNPSAELGGASVEPLSSLTFTITDNDAPPMIRVESVSKVEGDSGVVEVNLAVSLSAPSGRELVLGLAAVGGTATVGEDYLPVSGSVTLAPGELSGTFTVRLLGDRIREALETILLEPVVLTGGAHPVEAGTVKIEDDDPTKPVFVLEDLPISIPESAGSLVLTLRRYGDVSGADLCRVKVDEGEGTMRLEETEYAFEPGQQVRSVLLHVMDDTLDELDENGTIVLIPEPPGEAPVMTYPVLVVDDDEPPAVFVEGPDRITERDAAEVKATVQVRLSAPSGLPIEVKVITTSISATEGVDYGSISVVIPFAPGEIAHTLELTVLGDRLDEGEEEFWVGPISASNARVGAAGLRVVIVDNDRLLRTYREWLETHFTAAERREESMIAPCADPDGDGLNNAAEFYLDSNPRLSESGRDRMSLVRHDGGMTWVIDGRSSRAAFVEPTFAETDDLNAGLWGPLRRAEEYVVDLSGDIRRHKILAPFTGERLFLRLNVVCREVEPEP